MVLLKPHTEYGQELKLVYRLRARWYAGGIFVVLVIISTSKKTDVSLAILSCSLNWSIDEYVRQEMVMGNSILVATGVVCRDLQLSDWCCELVKGRCFSEVHGG